MSDDYSTTSDTTSDTSTDTSDTSEMNSTDTVDTSDLPEDTSGSDGSEDLPEDNGSTEETSDTADSDETDESIDGTDESSDVTDTTDTENTDVSDTDTDALPETTGEDDGSDDLPDNAEPIDDLTGVNKSDGDVNDIEEPVNETEPIDNTDSNLDEGTSDVGDATNTEDTDISNGDSDTMPENNEESDGSENLPDNEPSQEDIADNNETADSSNYTEESTEASDDKLNEFPDNEDDEVDDLPNVGDDDVEETSDSVESDDVNDEQSYLEKGITDTTNNSGTDDLNVFSERNSTDNSDAYRNKSYANDDLGNAERERDEAYQELLDYRNANNLGRSMEPSKEEQRLIDKANETRDNYEKLKHAQELRDAMADNSNEYRSIVESLNDSGVNHRPIEKSEYDRSTKDIIDYLGGGDLTQGSCSSLAFAYAGNKAGYNVLDFRDGESRSFFSQNSSIGSIANLPNVDSRTVYGKDDINCANELMKSMDPGKDYYLATGQHASIVRKADDGYQYLELQSAHNNGWKTLDDNALQNRFGCASDNQYEYPNFLIDVDSLGNSAEFRDILGYINTAENQQMKGVYGHVR